MSNKQDNWTRARQHIAWAIRQKISLPTILTIPDEPLLNLSDQDKKILKGCLNSRFRGPQNDKK
jgi:hypothetical protein